MDRIVGPKKTSLSFHSDTNLDSHCTSVVVALLQPLRTLSSLRSSLIPSAILQESEFRLSRPGIEAVRRFKQSAEQFEGGSQKWQAGSEKPEVMVPGRHFLLVGGCRETGIFRQAPLLPSHRYYSIKTINFIEITITTTPLTRVLACLIRGGISLCGDVVYRARPGRHNYSNSILVL